jgi:hypothetical protein
MREWVAGLLACKPSADGELWCCYLEKALAVHCGGWDQINGGLCTHAWRLLTGCRNTYVIRSDAGEDGEESFSCLGEFNPNTEEWCEKQNSSSSSSSCCCCSSSSSSCCCCCSFRVPLLR